jgi:hypothetical protein
MKTKGNNTWLKRAWKGLVTKRKYEVVLYALAEYVCGVAAIQYADEVNKPWYDSRLAAAAILFCHLYRRDGLRFLRCFDNEECAIAGFHFNEPLVQNAIERWQEFSDFTGRWRRKYYSPEKRRDL